MKLIAAWHMNTTRSASAYESTAAFRSSGLSSGIIVVECLCARERAFILPSGTRSRTRAEGTRRDEPDVLDDLQHDVMGASSERQKWANQTVSSVCPFAG